jgi:CheY-like chemotaxis protein
LVGKRPVVVDDDADSRLLITRVLEDHGARVLSADSYQSAVKLLDAQVDVDIFLLDIGMPERDGYALIAKIRSIPKYRHTPALAVTAFVTENDRKMVFSAGFQGYIAKPFQLRDVISRVASFTHKDPDERQSA